MPTKFADFMREIEDEARAEGPGAVAHLRELQAHFRLGRQIAQARLARSMTQSQVASLAGVDQSDVSNMERGASNPTVKTFDAIVRALGLSIELREAGAQELFTRRAPPRLLRSSSSWKLVNRGPTSGRRWTAALGKGLGRARLVERVAAR